MIQRPEAKGATAKGQSPMATSQRDHIEHDGPPWRRQSVEQWHTVQVPIREAANWEKLIRSAGRSSMNPLDKFEISIRRKDGKIIAAAPQLGLYATATDIHGAIDALERKKAALLEDLTAAGELETLSPVAFANPIAPSTSHGLARFTLKVGIVVVLIAIAMVVTTNLLATKSETTRAAWQTTLQEHR